MATAAQPVFPLSPEARARRLQQLRENEIDLRVALDDVTEEIASRERQVGVLVAQLRETRREIIQLTFGGTP